MDCTDLNLRSPHRNDGRGEIMRRLIKLTRIFSKPAYAKALLRHWIAAGVEHEAALSELDCGCIVDIGANVGQFALAARDSFPEVKIWAFEPQNVPAGKFAKLFARDSRTTLFVAGIGPCAREATMHISAMNHSSSLLPITRLQSQTFPGTEAAGMTTVNIAPLDQFLTDDDIGQNGLLKIDVQGYELEVLKGSVARLPNFSFVYVEASFMELYKGQALLHEVIQFLREHGFQLCGLFQPIVDSEQRTIQGDFLFKRLAAV